MNEHNAVDVNVPSEMDMMRDADPDFAKAYEAEQAGEAGQEAPQDAGQAAETPPAEAPAAEEKDTRTVPLGALHEERQRRKELQQEVRQARERQQRMEQRFEEFVQRIQQPQQPEQPQGPGFEDDPATYLRNQNERLAEQLNQQGAYLQQQANQQQQVQAANNLVGRYRSDSMAYAKENPDFPDAYNHVSNARMAMYTAAGMSQQEAEMALQRDEFDLVANAYQRGASPAQAIHEMARAMGYKPAQADASAQPAAAVVNEEMAKAEEAQKLSQGMGSGQAPRGGAPSLSDIADMDGEEFDKAFDQMARNLRGF